MAAPLSINAMVAGLCTRIKAGEPTDATVAFILAQPMQIKVALFTSIEDRAPEAASYHAVFSRLRHSENMWTDRSSTVSRPVTHDRVAYSARYLTSQPMGHFHGHTRGGFSIGEAAFKRGVLIGVAPDWTDIAFVRWDDQPEIAVTTHIDNLVPEREIGRDAESHQHSSGDRA